MFIISPFLFESIYKFPLSTCHCLRFRIFLNYLTLTQLLGMQKKKVLYCILFLCFGTHIYFFLRCSAHAESEQPKPVEEPQPTEEQPKPSEKPKPAEEHKPVEEKPKPAQDKPKPAEKPEEVTTESGIYHY